MGFFSSRSLKSPKSALLKDSVVILLLTFCDAYLFTLVFPFSQLMVFKCEGKGAMMHSYKIAEKLQWLQVVQNTAGFKEHILGRDASASSHCI